MIRVVFRDDTTRLIDATSFLCPEEYTILRKRVEGKFEPVALIKTKTIKTIEFEIEEEHAEPKQRRR